jgi:hypothetical protein
MHARHFGPLAASADSTEGNMYQSEPVDKEEAAWNSDSRGASWTKWST